MNRRARIVFLACWITFIFLLTGFPSIPVPPIKQFPVDKLAHLLMFLIMGLLQRRLFRFRSYCLLGIAVVLIAEFQQLFIPGRTFEIGDILAGLLGIAIPLFIFRIGGRRDRVAENLRRTHDGFSET